MPHIAVARRIAMNSNATVVRQMRDAQGDYGRTFTQLARTGENT
jgi:hypothetical protein